MTGRDLWAPHPASFASPRPCPTVRVPGPSPGDSGADNPLRFTFRLSAGKGDTDFSETRRCALCVSYTLSPGDRTVPCYQSSSRAIFCLAQRGA